MPPEAIAGAATNLTLLQRKLDDAKEAAKKAKTALDDVKGMGEVAAMQNRAAEANNTKPEKPKPDRRAETLARESVATKELVAGLYGLAAAYEVSDAAALKAEITAKATEQGIKKQADVAAYVAEQMQKATAEQVAAGAKAAADLRYQARAQAFVNEQVRAGKLPIDDASTALQNMAQQRDLVTAMNMAGAEADKKGYEAAKKALQDLTNAQLANIKAQRESDDLKKAAQFKDDAQAIERETALLVQLGEARLAAMRSSTDEGLADALAEVAAQHEKIAIQAAVEAEQVRLLAQGYVQAAAAVMLKAEADKAQVDARLEIDKQTASIDRYNAALRETVSQLGEMGKVGAVVGGALALLTGKTGALGGAGGKLLNLKIGTDDKGMAKTLGTELSKVFKKDGPFAKTMQPIMQNAGLGMQASSAIFGKQSKEAEIGSAIGGALGGSKIVEKGLSKGLESISKGLGQFAGPLGSMLGGVLGSALGGMLTKVKWGAVSVSASGVTQSGGNDDKSQKAAMAAGNTVLDGLTDLATKLGGAIGDFGNITVGVRHGDYRVNTTGTSLKIKNGATEFDDDAEAAVAYAMKVAIERGAITGIRASTNALLKAGTDLQTQLTKAVQFESVFDDLQSVLDPVGFELDSLTKEFDQLRVIFKEAGASAEEYAQLEQLLTIKRQQAMDKEQDALNDIKSRIAEAQGDDATVTAIARARELRDATSDAQRAELQRLFAIEDEIAAQEKLTDAQQAATSAAEALRSAWEQTGKSIRDEIDRIRGLKGGEEAASCAGLQGRFTAAATAARGGDQTAAASLVDLSQSLIEAAGKSATSRQELDRVKAETAANLEGVWNYIQAFQSGSASASASASASVGSASSAATDGTAATSASGSGDAAAEIRALRSELERMRADMTSGHATIAGNTGRIARKLDDVTSASGGDAIAVVGVAA